MTQIASSIPVIDESQTRNIRLKHNEQPQYEQLNRMLANHEHISKDQHTVENYKTFKHDVTYKATHIVRDKGGQELVVFKYPQTGRTVSIPRNMFEVEVEA